MSEHMPTGRPEAGAYYASLYSAAQAELSALREELAASKQVLEATRIARDAEQYANEELREKLKAAEQRNADLLATLRSALQGVEMVGLQDHRIDYALAANIKAEIESVLGRKPTESGASE